MNWEAIGAFGEVLGAAVVLVTLIYVAIQLKQTNDISRFNATKELLEPFDNLSEMIVSDASLRQVMQKAEALSPDEEEQIYAFTNMYCNTWLRIQSAYDNGLIDIEFFTIAKQDLPFQLSRWRNMRPAVNKWLGQFPDLREYEIFSQLE